MQSRLNPNEDFLIYQSKLIFFTTKPIHSKDYIQWNLKQHNGTLKQKPLQMYPRRIRKFGAETE